MRDIIHPETLKVLRSRRNWSQQRLADELGCGKDTVSRWERGASRAPNGHLRERLAHCLGVNWEVLTRPLDEEANRSKAEKSDLTVALNLQISRSARNELALASLRYNVPRSTIVELAPLLFVIIAEGSLLKRRQSLEAIEKAIKEADSVLSNQLSHLSGHIDVINVNSTTPLWDEEESIRERDIFGRKLSFVATDRDEHWDPFFNHLRDLAEGISDSALHNLSIWNLGDFDYEVADDTLRQKTGLSDGTENENIIQLIRTGQIDLSEFLRKKRDLSDEAFSTWLVEQVKEIEEHGTGILDELLDEILRQKAESNGGSS